MLNDREELFDVFVDFYLFILWCRGVVVFIVFCIEMVGEDGMQGMWCGVVFGFLFGFVYVLFVVYVDYCNVGCIIYDLGLCFGLMVLVGCDLGCGVDVVLGFWCDQVCMKFDCVCLV